MYNINYMKFGIVECCYVFKIFMFCLDDIGDYLIIFWYCEIFLVFKYGEGFWSCSI